MPLILLSTQLNMKKLKSPQKNSAAAVPKYESKYDDEDADNINDESELASGSQYDEFDNGNSVNSNGYICCNVPIGNKSVQIIDAEIDTVDQNSVDDGGLMESSDLGYEFHDNFVPVRISAGNAADSSSADESNASDNSL